MYFELSIGSIVGQFRLVAWLPYIIMCMVQGFQRTEYNNSVSYKLKDPVPVKSTTDLPVRCCCFSNPLPVIILYIVVHS